MNQFIEQPASPSSERSVEIETVLLSPADERANILTHALGCLLSLLAGIFFYRQTASLSLGLRTSCLLFCFAMAVVYLCSTLSHAVYDPRRRNLLRAWDQGTIYLLIVGTYTPFIWQGSQGTIRTMLLTACWTAAVLGFCSKVFWSHRINAVSTASYLALGWLPAIPLVRTTPLSCVIWMVIGGVCFSVGVIFLKLSPRIRFSHAAWHVMVMLGSASHAYAIYLLVLSA